MAEITCPFCGFKHHDEYAVQLHIEEHHTEDSPFAVNEDSKPLPSASTIAHVGSSAKDSKPGDTWTKCTRPGCGEYVLLADVDDHLEVHDAIAAAEMDSEEETKSRIQERSKHSRSDFRDTNRSPQKLRKSKAPESNGSRGGRSVLDYYFSGTSYKGRPAPPRRRLRQPREPGRLGREELGPHAFEKAMPADVRRRLLNDALPRATNRIGKDGKLHRETIVDNETSGLISVLSDLCALDPNTEATYFCDTSVKHVTKLRCDGNFCGYWNIQMLLTYIHDRDRRNSDREPRPVPNVLQIQDVIERAWDNGICTYGRIETGGIRGTRKWIGTHEALAFFTQVKVKVEALSFQDDEDDANPIPAVVSLLDHIEAYFISGLEGAKKYRTSHITSLPPVYFQRLGHSMTIVGLERKKDGSRNLLIFDPSFATSEGMKRLVAGRNSNAQPDTLMKIYRRSDVALNRWNEFEIIVPQPSEGDEQ